MICTVLPSSASRRKCVAEGSFTDDERELMALCTGFLFCHVSKSQGKTWSSVAAAFIHHSMCSCFRLQLLLFDQETGCIFRWPLEFHKVVLRVSSMVTHAAVNLL